MTFPPIANAGRSDNRAERHHEATCANIRDAPDRGKGKYAILHISAFGTQTYHQFGTKQRLQGRFMGKGKLRMIHVVDDDDDVRDSTRVLLESLGFAVRVFASATEFLREASGQNADCLLVDLHMPDMTGLELLETLRARKVHTPAIIVTANGDKLNLRLAHAGALMVLRKPVAGAELAGAIERACAGT